jgi:hypothetical protein
MWVSETSRGAQEAAGDEAKLLCVASCGRFGVALEALEDDVLDAADVDQVKAQSAPAGTVDPGASVLIDES